MPNPFHARSAKLTVALVLLCSCKGKEPAPAEQEKSAEVSAKQEEKAPAMSLPNVIVIVVDTLRADHLGFAGYEAHPTSPNLDALAQFSFVFENAYASAPWTRSSLASLFTSKHPMQHQVLAEGEDPENFLKDEHFTLAEYFSDLAYLTAGYFTNPHYAFGLEQGFQAPNRRFNLVAKNVYEEAIQWLSSQAKLPVRQPYFLLVHNLDPHDEYRHHPSYPWAPPDSPYRLIANLFPKGQKGGGVGESCDMRRAKDLSDEELAEMRACYDQEIAYTDNHIGHFLSFLKKSGELERSIVIFTSDHGEEFGEHMGFWHGCTLRDVLLRVPLVVWIPGLKGRRIKERVALIDVFPTLVDLIGGELPADTQLSGQSLMPLIKGEPFTAKPLFFATGFRQPVRYGVIDGEHKLVRHADGGMGLFGAEHDNQLKPDSEEDQAEIKRLGELLDSVSSPGFRARVEASKSHSKAWP
jgi:arylsulfatase A-like enzyme